MGGRLIGDQQGIEEGFILLARHRAVEIGAVLALFLPSVDEGHVRHCLLAVARGAEGGGLVDGVAGDDGRDRVVECERFDAKLGGDRRRERVGCERACRDDADVREGRDLLSNDANTWVRR